MGGEDTSHYVSSFRGLFVYQKSIELARLCYQITLKFPPEEKYSLTDQIRRSSRAIGANIGEAWGKREYSAHFISKLSDSLAESHETQVWLDHARDCGYLSNEQHEEADNLANHVGALLRQTSLKANNFCGKLDRT
ncbi:MAG: four helix bundle protein [Akkermansiaceae bacterium]